MYIPKTKTRNRVNINSITLPLPDVLRYNFNINLLKHIRARLMCSYYRMDWYKRVLERHPAYTTLTVRINIIQQRI